MADTSHAQAAARPIALSDVQSNVLRGYRVHEALPHVAYVLLAFGDQAGARAFVAGAAALTTSCSAWDELAKASGDERFVWNLGFTYVGLEALGIDAKASFPVAEESESPQFGRFQPYAAFAYGAVQRAEELGDRYDSAPDKWDPVYRSDSLHAVVSLSAWNPAGIAHARAQLDALLAKHADGARAIGEETADALPGGVEHFGFADGIGQPFVEDSGLAALPGEGTPTAKGWKPIPAGEFVLGYPNALTSPPDCEPHSQALQPLTFALLENGSFLVLRKLHERVAAFRAWVAQEAQRTRMSEEYFAARLVGRWRSGAPLALAPAQDDPALGADPKRNNDFRFAPDPNGFLTAFGAHIRRANPRDDVTGPTPNQIAARRIIRRSTPYGTPLPAGAPDDGADRGILFVAINADIERQFEFIQSKWLNSTLSSKRLTLEADKDPLVGANDAGDGKFTIPGPNGPVFVWNLPRFVTVRGAAYFFLPGLRALRSLADGSA